ncbi:MAG: hypothetical protein ACK6CP_18575 [Pseudanabaena sp.]|nr:hypothetical protein [Pseudanabaena sp. M090S1SP2A07QC]MCA6527211.1 hypothetical protein [Pseudanabaena sp. M179S2SP2A07QC]MCA6535083.1 hypothetical protein [Pseudanabaena sp. M176S2SP2A07QC]MCA6540728.1 hypothetical protein [Pseudanabaena sp. M037S2SP2A07QC]MCA6566990.1 hypothetical protein [Pseudanabaena sp. M151S2SP2A07QC]MCA6578583.1 hypothetical protein [Pseudanabaena sp. M085S1SP2A07QC]MCE2886553.1 hypothetical protein [Pseudanabaena sp. 42896M_M3]
MSYYSICTNSCVIHLYQSQQYHLLLKHHHQYKSWYGKLIQVSVARVTP